MEEEIIDMLNIQHRVEELMQEGKASKLRGWSARDISFFALCHLKLRSLLHLIFLIWTFLKSVLRASWMI